MKVRRIVSNIAASDIEAAKCSYHDMLGLDVMMDLGWSRPTSRYAQSAPLIEDAFIITISPPPVRGIGTAGGFKMMVQDKRGRGLPALEA
ncbi:MAG TPA: hypothetical protein VNZ48_02090, partial [Xanthobacteraceae bacterium]|nr:hypothetical protein [Xanthobacteraceae bacterium]